MMAGSAASRRSSGNYQQSGNGGSGGGNGGGGGGNGRNNGGGRHILFPILIVVVIVIMIIGIALVFRNGNFRASGDGETRTKLESNLCVESSQWIDDELGWIDSKSTVESAMEYFYDETGVQPYLILTDNIDGNDTNVTDAEAEAYLDDVYDSLYSDEGHMIFLFVQGPSRYWTWVYTGTAANSVIDNSGKEIVYDYADRYYSDTSLTNDEYFSLIFEDSADTLMIDPSHQTRSRNMIILILVIGVILIILLLVVRQLTIAKIKQAEKTKEILDTPLGQSPEDEELEKKYSDDSSGGTS